MSENIGPEAKFLLDKCGDCLTGLIHYGSTAFGQPRQGSAYDFWLIVDDLQKFHRRFSPIRSAGGWPSSISERVWLNRRIPNFYGFEHDGKDIKIGVLHEDTFCRLCRVPSFYVKGRMQKPVRLIRVSDRIARAIHDARVDGVRWALDLLPSEFGFDEFLQTLLGLSYQTEIRPEITGRKIQDIIESGRAELERVYRPILESHPWISGRGDRYGDRRSAAAKHRARRRALRQLRHLRWSWETFQNICRNYMTYPTPVRYILKKIFGEIAKLFRRGKRGQEPFP